MSQADDRTPESTEPYEPVTHDEGQTTSTDEAPNPETGVGIGMGTEPTSFEPEEDPEAAATAAEGEEGSAAQG